MSNSVQYPFDQQISDLAIAYVVNHHDMKSMSLEEFVKEVDLAKKSIVTLMHKKP